MEDRTFKGGATITKVRFDISSHQRNFVYLLIVGLVMVNVLLMEMCTYLEAGLGLL